MPRIYETEEDYKGTGIACDRVREELKQCLLESDCVRVDMMSAKECLKTKPASLSNECVKLGTLLFECKRSMLDPRHRFRGRRDLD